MERGVIGATNIDYLRPAAAASHGDDRVRVVGVEGVVEVMAGAARVLNGDGERELAGKAAPSMLDAFAGQCAGGPPCPVSARDALAMTRACLLARRAADERCLCSW